jgi:hypothetical protein
MNTYLDAATLRSFIGQRVTIRRHYSPTSGRISTIHGTLREVHEAERPGCLSPYGTMDTDHGRTAVDLSLVLEITPATGEATS